MNRTILVVDDDDQIRESLAKVLRVQGYEVILAADGQRAAGDSNLALIDLVVLDLNLPQESGWDLFERFTSLNPLLPIIIITGRTNQYPLASAAGVGALMEKPLNVPLLLQTIAELLEEPVENRLKRLVGMKSLARYSAPTHVPSKGFRNDG